MKTTIEGYVVRNDKWSRSEVTPSIFLYGNPYGKSPMRGPMDAQGTWRGVNRIQLPTESFPEVTWKTGAKKVRITVEVEDV